MPQIFGKVVSKLPEVSGENANGEWVRGGFVISPTSDPSKRVAIEAMGVEKVGQIAKLKMGQDIMVTYTVESREYGDRWFTSARLISLQAFIKDGGSHVG